MHELQRQRNSEGEERRSEKEKDKKKKDHDTTIQIAQIDLWAVFLPSPACVTVA